MTDNVTFLSVDTTLPIPVERILASAIDANLTEAVVIGWGADGRLYLAASHGDLGGHLILFERAKATLLEQDR